MELAYLPKGGQIEDGGLFPTGLYFLSDSVCDPLREGPLGILLRHDLFVAALDTLVSIVAIPIVFVGQANIFSSLGRRMHVISYVELG